jgi:hypothetical protein
VGIVERKDLVLNLLTLTLLVATVQEVFLIYWLRILFDTISRRTSCLAVSPKHYSSNEEFWQRDFQKRESATFPQSLLPPSDTSSKTAVWWVVVVISFDVNSIWEDEKEEEEKRAG